VSLYTGWARTGRTWRAVTEGQTCQDALRALLAWIGARTRPPRQSAVLPTGVAPDAYEARQDAQADGGGPQVGYNGVRAADAERPEARRHRNPVTGG
jgi:hypothetical protein